MPWERRNGEKEKTGKRENRKKRKQGKCLRT
jgi:hypothetical protein